MRTKDLTTYALLTALALVLSYLESLLPLSFAVPGVKMGLPNIAVLFALYRLGGRGACAVSLTRVALVSILFGNLFSLAYSAAGAALSLLVMLPLKKSGKFGVPAVSVSGGVAHNVGQVSVAIVVLETRGLIWYLPPLCVSGIAAGLLVGLASALLIKRADIAGK